MNYYQRHLGDYARDTGHLTLLEHGVYGALLDWQYGTEKPLPSEAAAVHRICRALSKAEKNAADRIKKEFFEESGWNKRAKREIDEYAVSGLQKRIGALKKHHPELAGLSDEQVVEWCTSNGYALDKKGNTTNTRARAKNPESRIQNPSIGGGEHSLPEMVSDDTIIQFGKKFPGEPASGAPGPMDPQWVLEFIKKINGRNTFPSNWQRLMISSWRTEWRGYKPQQGKNFEKNGEKNAVGVSASVRLIELERRKKTLEANRQAAVAVDIQPDKELLEELAALEKQISELSK